MLKGNVVTKVKVRKFSQAFSEASLHVHTILFVVAEQPEPPFRESFETGYMQRWFRSVFQLIT